MRILLIEDESDSADVTRRVLLSFGHTVEVADCIASAKAMCAMHLFDMVICDIRLPDGDGWHLMPELRRRYQIRGIALSALSSPEDTQRSLESGFDAHLKKPLDFMSLVEAMKLIQSKLPIHDENSDGTQSMRMT